MGKSRFSEEQSLGILREGEPSGESDGDAGDQSIGFDRFGRVVDPRWIGDVAATAWVRIRYWFDPKNPHQYSKDVLGARLRRSSVPTHRRTSSQGNC